MSIIIENIKLYNPLKNSYLLRSLIFHLLLLILPIGLAAGMEPELSIHSASMLFSIVCFCIYMIFLGENISLIQVDILSKPLSFCLPHYDKVSYKIILHTGIVANIILGIIFIILPHPDGLKGVLFFITILAAGLVSYLLSVYITLKTQSGFALYLFIILNFLNIFILDSDKVTFSADLFLRLFSIPLLLLLPAILLAVHKTLTHPDFKRNLSLNKYAAIDLMSLNKRIEQNISRKVNRLPARDIKEPPTEKLFLKLTKTFPLFKISRAITLDIYSMLESFYTLNTFSHKVATLIMVIFLPIFFLLLGGYNIELNNVIIKFDWNSLISFLTSFMLCLIASLILVSQPHNLLLPKGRSFQFRNIMGRWLIISLLATVWTLLIILLSRITASLIPDITIMGHTFKFNPLEASIILWPLIIIPIIAELTFSRRGRNPSTGFLPYFLVALTLSVSGLLSANSSYRQVSFAGAIIVFNGLFIISNARYWFRRDCD